MIGYLQGVALKLSPNLILLDVRGVGYEVQIPLSTYYELRKLPEGAPIALYVHTHVRDDALALFGFRTEPEHEIFGKLIAVSGIGPKLAQNILSGITPRDLAAALSQGDVRRLCAIPGVGKKTAQRMVFELGDKLVLTTEEQPEKSRVLERELIDALINLGYSRAMVERAVRKLAQEEPELEFADQLKAALRILSRGRA